MNKNKEQSNQISARKLAANRKNARKSTGPRDTRLTRYNAVKHGLLAHGMTELDDSKRHRAVFSRLEKQLRPIGELENFLVWRIAFCRMRLDRAALIEAEFITATLHPPVTKTTYPDDSNWSDLLERCNGKTEVIDPGLPARLSMSDVETLEKLQRYECALENKFYRAVNQLERLQRMRRGERIPAPTPLDSSVHNERD